MKNETPFFIFGKTDGFKIRKQPCVLRALNIILLTFCLQLNSEAALPDTQDEKQTGPVNGEEWVSPENGIEFVWVASQGMWVGKYEVTNEDYRRKKPKHRSRDYNGQGLNGERQPVVFISFGDAKAYAAWLTDLDHKDGKLPDDFIYRLPTRNEWLHFAQCGDGREYPWGPNWPPVGDQTGNYAGEETKYPLGLSFIKGYRDTHVGACDVEKSWKNQWGLYGVGGNVWECTTDIPNGRFDAWRGASWYSHFQGELRSSYRLDRYAFAKDAFYGFRLVLSRAPAGLKPAGVQ